MKVKPGETVVFAWIVYTSRAHRDNVNTKVMKDPRLAKMIDSKAMPFDCKRMCYGGFKVLVDAWRPRSFHRHKKITHVVTTAARSPPTIERTERLTRERKI